MLVQRPHRVEESRAAAARGEGRHVDDAGGDEELLDDLPEGVDARGIEILFARYFLDLDAFGPHLARVFDARPGKVRDSPPSKLRFKFDLEDEEGSLGMGEFADAAQHVLQQFAGGPHKGLMPELHLALTYDCMDGGEDARVFLVMPDLTDDWAPCYESVDIVTAVPRERDIDGVARYCFKKVARELLSAVIKPTKKPRFYYVKTATGG